MLSRENEVRKASEQFHAGLSRMANGDVGPLSDIWLQSSDAAATHPIGGREAGWDKVQVSFQQVVRVASAKRKTLEDQILQVTYDLAYELGVECGGLKLVGQQAAINGRVTNIYRREAGKWKLVRHHPDIAPAMLAVFNRLLAKT